MTSPNDKPVSRDGVMVLPTDPDAQRCIACGKDTLDTGWECTECGYDCMPWYNPQGMLAARTQPSQLSDTGRKPE